MSHNPNLGGGGHAPSPDGMLSNARVKEYPKQIWYLYAAFIGTVAAIQLLSFIHTKLYWRHSRSSPENRSIIHRLTLAILNGYRILAFRTTLRFGSYSLNLAEVFVTFAYIIALFTWSFINTTTTTGQRLSPTYWRGRTGSLCAVQMPLITALGTKNNIISRQSQCLL